MRRWRKVLVSAGVAVGAVGAVGAATTTTASARSTALRAAGTAPPPVTSASFGFSVSLSGLGPSSVTITGSGQVDFVHDAVSASVVLPASVAGLLPGGGGAAETVQAVLAGGTLYLQVPALASLTGKPWISLSAPSAPLAGVFGTVAAALGNVSGVVSFASSHHATVSSLGSSTVDSTAVTGSSISVGTGAFSLDAVLWANSSNQLVQGNLPVGIGSGGPAVSATVDLSGYDAPVTITAPSSGVTPVPASLAQNVVRGAIGNTKALSRMVKFTDSVLMKKGHGRRAHGGRAHAA